MMPDQEDIRMSRQYVLSTADEDRWRQVLPADLCVMASLEYAKVLERQSGFPARLFVVETGQSVIGYPFFVRPIAALPFAGEAFEGLWDTFTPEYTGPLYVRSGSGNGSEETGFADLFAAFCRENGIVAEFAHLSPWHDSGPLLDSACVVEDREVVQVDLAPGETGIWTESLNSDARRQTRQAGKAGVTVRRAGSLDDVRVFHRLHADTMERLEALERYRIPADYFIDIFEIMPENAFYVLSEYEGRVVAGGLYFHGGSDVYWHLSAVDREYSRVRPVNKYLWETILWAAKAGKRRLLLGGGYKENDGVFRFKAGFSPLRARFCTYRRVHDRQAFDTLNNAWSEYYGIDPSKTDFFPAYRWIPENR
jgi:serine/alanine adding enzyme